jgi:hypothetical protein
VKLKFLFDSENFACLRKGKILLVLKMAQILPVLKIVKFACLRKGKILFVLKMAQILLVLKTVKSCLS